MVRSAGSWGQVMAKDKGMAQLQMPSGEIRLVSEDCRATVGQIGLIEHSSLFPARPEEPVGWEVRPTVRSCDESDRSSARRRRRKSRRVIRIR
jgi:large subunit ribosomal protein L2